MKTEKAEAEHTSLEELDTRDVVDNAKYVYAIAGAQHKCSESSKIFKYGKAFEKHILSCTESPVVPAELETQYDLPGSGQGTNKNNETDTPMDEEIPTYHTNIPKLLGAAGSAVESTEVRIGDFIIVEQLNMKETKGCNVRSASKYRTPHSAAIKLNKPANNLDIKEENLKDLKTTESLEQKNITIKLECDGVEEFQAVDGESDSITALPLGCDPCLDSFSFPSHTESHSTICEAQHDIASHHIARHQCAVCQAGFVSSSGLKQHMRTHSKPEFECDICGRSFTQKAALADHRNNHLGLRPHKCTFCTQTFSCRQVLSYHRKTQHYAELKHPKYANNNSSDMMVDGCHPKPYEDIGENPCDEMDLFVDNPVVQPKDSTSSHPYACPICPSTYADRKNLHSHLNTHTNRFKCDVCDKRFQNHSALRRHMQVHRRVSLPDYHTCNFCTRRFSTLQGLRCHNTLLHNSQNQPDYCEQDLSNNTALGIENSSLNEEKGRNACDEMECLDSNKATIPKGSAVGAKEMDSSTKRNNALKRYRKKLKLDSLRLEISRARARERAARYRKRKKLLKSNDNKTEKAKEQNRKRQQQFRLKEKNADEEEVNPAVNHPYKCKRSLEKALKKVEAALPADLKKRAHIADILYKKYVTYGPSSSEQQTEPAIERKKQFVC